jgi:hypothetical protein
MNGLSCHVVCIMFQGPLGWQSLSGLPVGQSLLDRDMEFFINADEHVEIGAVSWEATIQKHVEEELYDSSLEVCAYFSLDTSFRFPLSYIEDYLNYVLREKVKKKI